MEAVRPLFFVTATAAEWRAAAGQDTGMDEGELGQFQDGAGRRHYLCISGVGPLNAAMSLGKYADHAREAKAVVNLGVAGSFDLNAAPLGSAWQVTREIWPEYGLAVDGGGADPKALGFPLWRGGEGKEEETVWDRLDLPKLGEMALGKGMQDLNLPQAVSLSVAGVTNTLDRAARLRAKYGALLENMEGFALAYVCARHGIPFVELRTVSNLVGSRAPQHRNFPLALNALRPLLHKLLEKA